MDPNDCMKRLNFALSSTGDMSDAAEHAENLYAWIVQGGFPPLEPITQERIEPLRGRAKTRVAQLQRLLS